MPDETFEPRIIGFLCNWCSYRAADLAGTARMKFAPNVRNIRVMCSGRVDPAFVLKAFSLGADGVLIAGCHPGECHYIEQNYKTMRRVAMLRHTLKAMGIEPDRLEVWTGDDWEYLDELDIEELIGDIVMSSEVEEEDGEEWREYEDDLLFPEELHP